MTCIDISKFSKRAHLASLKLNLNKLDINKLLTTPIDLSKVSNAVKKDVAKTTVFDELVKSVDATQTNGTIYFVKNAERDTKIKDIERNILDHA